MSPSEDRVLTRPILAELLKMETARTPESEPGPQVSDMSFSGNRVPTQLPGLTKTLILQRVQKLTLGLGGKRLTLAQARAIVSLPNLRTLRINRLFAINGLPSKARGVALDWRLCTHLEEFVLQKTLLSGTHIAKLLRLCPKRRSSRLAGLLPLIMNMNSMKPPSKRLEPQYRSTTHS